jgi:hypothetical protein
LQPYLLILFANCFQEATTGEIDLQEDEPEIVANMIKFLYKDSYEDGNESTATAATTGSTTAAKTSEAKGKKAQKVQSQRKTPQTSTPQSSTSTEASKTVESAEAVLINTKVYIIGDKYDIQPLKDLAAKKYGEALLNHWNSAPFVASLKLVYEETLENDRPLKDLAVKTAAKHAKELTDRDDFASLCKENAEITFDVLKASLKITPGSICPECETGMYVRKHTYEACDYCCNCRSIHDMTNPYYCVECEKYFCSSD